jgi:hypothetical protein
MGDLSLSLRSLTNSDQPSDDEEIKGLGEDNTSQVSILRFGIPSQATPSSKE